MGNRFNECQYGKEAQDVYLICHYFPLGYCSFQLFLSHQGLNTKQTITK